MTSPRQVSRPAIELFQKTDPGRDPSKATNEDAMAYRETRLGHLLVVCDGMGGHEAGKEASELAVQTIIAMTEGAPEGLTPGQLLKGAIEQAGRAVFHLGGSPAHFGRPGSTVVAALIHSGGTDIAHVGDSRAYCIRAGQIYPLTRDHSMVQQMIDAGFLQPEEAYGHPDGNKITRALGLLENTDVELRPEPLIHETGDIFLLATDGLFDVVRAEEALEVVLDAPNLELACDRLIDLANERGGPDNITVQLARIIEAGIALVANGPGATQLADHSELRQADLRQTLLETPAVTKPVDPNDTLMLGTPADFDSNKRTLLDDSDAPVTERAPVARTQADALPLDDEAARPSQRGGLFLGLGIGVVWLIIAAVALWWLFRPSSKVPDTPPQLSDTEASEPVLVAPPPVSATETAPVAVPTASATPSSEVPTPRHPYPNPWRGGGRHPHPHEHPPPSATEKAEPAP